MKKIIILLFSILSTFTFSDTILTDNNVTYTLTNMLTKNIGVNVKSVFETNTSMQSSQNQYFDKDEFNLNKYKDMVAIVDIKEIWQQESLYTYARRNNIRVVEIDASKSYSNNSSSVLTLINDNTFVWLDFNNAKKMLKIIASDLIQLYPDKKEIINNNLFKSLNDIKIIEDKYLDIDNIDGAIILDEALSYLLSYLNIPYVYAENREDILKISKDTGYNIVLTSKGENRKFKKLLNDNNIKLELLKTGSFPIEDTNDEELMSKDALIEIYNFNLKQLNKLNKGE